VQYTSRVDALTHDNIHVQIKLTKKGSENMSWVISTKSRTWWGFWQENKTNIVEEIYYRWYLETTLTYENQQEMNSNRFQTINQMIQSILRLGNEYWKYGAID